MIAPLKYSRPWLRYRNKYLQNPHFWIITCFMLFITLFYYENLIFGQRVFPFSWSLKLFEFNYNIIGSLYGIPLIYSALVFWWRGALITWLISMAIILPQILTFRSDPAAHITNIFYLLIPLMVVIVFSLELNWRDKERKSLAERELERQTYLSQVFKAQEDERKRISQEIHDDSIQRLAVIASTTQLLATNQHFEDAPAIKQRVESIRDMIISVSQDLRRLSIDLRPTVLDDLGLIPSLRWLVDTFQQDSGIEAAIKITGEQKPLTKKITIQLFRIVQEALNNARKHSQATRIEVNIQFTLKTIRATIQDNGKGFRVPKAYDDLMSQGKLGLIGMQQRTQVLNGSLTINSEAGKGTLVSVEVGL
jgi:signal transduction histidine kinase